MGFSLPVSVGVAFANSNTNIYSISGDGGFHMSLQSLMLISQYNLPIKVIVMNNDALGMITQFQELYFDKKMVGTTKDGGYLVPDLKKISEAYKLKYFLLSEKDLENKDYLDEIMKERNCMIEYKIHGNTKVYPKLEYNNSIEKVSPILSEKELKDNMLIKI